MTEGSWECLKELRFLSFLDAGSPLLTRLQFLYLKEEGSSSVVIFSIFPTWIFWNIKMQEMTINAQKIPK
jgi:hypothetical protein